MMDKSLFNRVGLFFFAPEGLLMHSCPVFMGEAYGDFVNYPLSHDEVWEKHYRDQYGVDFDYYPRGRIIYNRREDSYILYYDGCIEAEAQALYARFGDARVQAARDEHYRCHQCNSAYADIKR